MSGGNEASPRAAVESENHSGMTIAAQCSSRIERAQARLVCRIPILSGGCRKPRPRCGSRAHKPKASCAVVYDYDQIPVARFARPARAGATARQRRICRSDHRNASICSTSVHAERSVNVSVEKLPCEEDAIFMRSQVSEKFGFMVSLSRLSPVARTGLRH